jgi:hypothetical protein
MLQVLRLPAGLAALLDSATYAADECETQALQLA